MENNSLLSIEDVNTVQTILPGTTLLNIPGIRGITDLPFILSETDKIWKRIRECGTKFAVLSDSVRVGVNPYYCNDAACPKEQCVTYRKNLFYGKYFESVQNNVFINVKVDDEEYVDNLHLDMVREFKTEKHIHVESAFAELKVIRKELRNKYKWFMLAYTSRGIELLRPLEIDEIPATRKEVEEFVSAYTNISSFEKEIIEFLKLKYKNKRRMRSKNIRQALKIFKNAIKSEEKPTIFHAMYYRPMNFIGEFEKTNLPTTEVVDARNCYYYVKTENIDMDLPFYDFVEKVRKVFGGKIRNMLKFTDWIFNSKEDFQIVTQFFTYFGGNNRKIIKIIENEIEMFVDLKDTK